MRNYLHLIRRECLLALAILLATFFLPGCRKASFTNSIDNTTQSLTTKASATALTIPTQNEALVAMQCYNNAFYNQYGTYGPSYKAYYYSDVTHTGQLSFWQQAEAIETLIDAYTTNNNTDFINKVQYLYNGMRDAFGLLWSNNIYNDDVIWGSLMCIRAFQITNDGGQLSMAQNNFDMVWSRAWDTNLGGGLWWTTDKTSKNACVNCPAAICAIYLYKATGNSAYLDKAKMIMDWVVSKLYNSSNGEVMGAMDASGAITQGARTYTQGTFIGACSELQPYYPSGNWTTSGQAAMDYTHNVMCNAQGLLPDEYDTQDCQGFKGIFARWACKFVHDHGLQSQYASWLDYNATQAWTYRNSNGLMWAQWWHRTPDNYVNGWETTDGISMMNGVYWF
jgi:predicted alpha-1,6-mannanase (GH76 family)